MTASMREAREKLQEQQRELQAKNLELEEKSRSLTERNTEIEQKNQDLENALAKLKRTQLQLVQSEKMASLGQLTAGIAHEINNPVNFVASNVSPLRRDIADLLTVLAKYEDIAAAPHLHEQFHAVDELKKKLEFSYLHQEIANLLNGIQEGARRTTEIVRGLRNFTRLGEDERKRADINKGIESTLLMLQHQLKNRVEVIKDFGIMPEIMCYPGKLNQVFMNLLANASQAIVGEGKIFIKTSYDGEIVTISIKDTGKGMTEEVKRHIFEPFYTTKGVGEGTGLGLSITYGIIEDHDGNIEVYSTPGKGSEFVITLPAK
jgi:signal transduction histidine kinase